MCTTAEMRVVSPCAVWFSSAEKALPDLKFAPWFLRLVLRDGIPDAICSSSDERKASEPRRSQSSSGGVKREQRAST